MMTGGLTEFAAERQRSFDNTTSADERKLRGHFGTPSTIAMSMAEMFDDWPIKAVRVLDAGAGVGSLSAAICQRALDQRFPTEIFFELWENDPMLIPFLKQTMSHCQKTLRDGGHAMEFVVREGDFILENTRTDLFQQGPESSFDMAILNPPYFKLRKESAQAQAMEHIVHGQPNIYALFLAVAADLLVPGGEMVAITPRSYFDGLYFKRFRKWFFDRMSVRQIHIFESRSDAFRGDDVLQENVILRAKKGGEKTEVILSICQGRDFSNVARSIVPYDQTLDVSNGDNVVRVTTNRLEREVVAAIDSLPQRFRRLGYEISTGPVVTFRSSEFLRQERDSNTAPLLWMHNVRPFVTQFLSKNGKPTHIEVSENSRRLLVPAQTYVLLKRFTSKEEKRRIVAGIMLTKDSYSEWVGLENHLNYVYRRDVELSQDEAFGLAAYFNSSLVDRYFRSMSGNTQVNATEIRKMPVPSVATLKKLGRQIQGVDTNDRTTVDNIVSDCLDIPRSLTNELIEAA